jgi:tetratricopeptide (TPR) repeat protein
MARFQKLEFQSQSETQSSSELDSRVPPGSEAWMTRADTCRRSGHYETSLQYFSRALEDDKALVAAWVGQVQMLVMLEEYPEAEIWSRKALELFPGDGDLHAARGQALCRLHRTKEAYGSIDAAMHQPGQSAYRWTVRGELLLAGRQEAERHCFDKAQQIDADWLVPIEIARIYLHYRQPSNALNRARLGVERGPGNAYAWYVQGVSLSELGMEVQAHKSFRTCLELCPGHRDAETRLQSLNPGSSLWKRLRSFWRS